MLDTSLTVSVTIQTVIMPPGCAPVLRTFRCDALDADLAEKMIMELSRRFDYALDEQRQRRALQQATGGDDV